MNVTELDHLEMQVSRLMHMIETLQSENAALRQKMAMYVQERTRLRHKNQRAVKQVKQIIKHIKEGLA